MTPEPTDRFINLMPILRVILMNPPSDPLRSFKTFGLSVKAVLSSMIYAYIPTAYTQRVEIRLPLIPSSDTKPVYCRYSTFKSLVMLQYDYMNYYRAYIPAPKRT
jgi:hypothetical protein